MLTIQRSFFPDKKSAIDHGIELPNACTKIALYKAIAAFLGIDITGMDDLDTLWAAIDAKNLDLACAGVAEHLIENESTIVDKMAVDIDKAEFLHDREMGAKLNKPILRRDRKPVPKPVKRGLTVVTNRVYPNQVMAKALVSKGLVIIK
jgi:hypothetical protein